MYNYVVYFYFHSNAVISTIVPVYTYLCYFSCPTTDVVTQTLPLDVTPSANSPVTTPLSLTLPGGMF